MRPGLIERPLSASLALLVVLLPSCSCAVAHEIDAAPDTNVDAGPDAWLCDPSPPPVLSCSPEADARCLAWAESLAPPGTFGRSRCNTASLGGCVVGDWIDASDPAHPQWGCAPGLVCRASEVCVSDVPGGPTRCAPICSAPPMDAGPGPRDTGAPRLYDGNVSDVRCDNRSITFPDCTPTEVEMCAVRAAAAAGGHFPHVTCGPAASLPGTSTCIAADACDDAGLCLCNATRVCASNEVCVSDTPDGPRYCIAACGL